MHVAQLKLDIAQPYDAPVSEPHAHPVAAKLDNLALVAIASRLLRHCMVDNYPRVHLQK
jgi:hypothetical protein